MLSNAMFPFFVLACILIQCNFVVSSRVSCYFVVPDDGEINDTSPCNQDGNITCPDSCYNCSCHNLTFYSNGTLFGNYTAFYFLPGNHTLHNVINVTDNFTNLTLMGYTDHRTHNSCIRPLAHIIQCEKDAGFLFMNITNLSVMNLRFNNCGFDGHNGYFGALMLRFVWNLYICGVDILFSRGWGLLCSHVHGTSLMKNSVVAHSHSYSNSTGGNVLLKYYLNNDTPEIINTISSFTIAHSNISNGSNGVNSSIRTKYYGGGIYVYISTSNKISIELSDVHLTKNSAKKGGNVAIIVWASHNAWSSSISIVNCTFLDGHAFIGGGVYVSLNANDISSTHVSDTSVLMKVTDSNISNNTADLIGAGVYLQLHEHDQLLEVADIYFEGCVLENNVNLKTNYSRGGSAVNVINFRVPGYVPHHTLQYRVSFVSCNFTANKAQKLSEDSVGSGTLYVEENSFLLLDNCLFSDNIGTGITAVHSNIVLQGNITLRNNSAYNGGGMVLCANSVIFMNLSVEVKLHIEHCSASNYGGGIYAEFECTQAIPPCFFQVSNSTEIPKALIYLTDNFANEAGTAIYGGAVDFCYSYGPYNRSNKTNVFMDLFHINFNQTDHSQVSSNPITVCFCNESGPDCSVHTKYSTAVYPGGMLSVWAVTVGQRNGTVPGYVMVSSNDPWDTRILKTNNTCTKLQYTVLSSYAYNQNKTITLSIVNNDFKNSLIDEVRNASVIVTVKECPPGFELCTETRQCVCAAWLRQLQEDVICKISSQSIQRNTNSTWWFSADRVHNHTNMTIFYSKFCPFDYCHKSDVNLSVTSEDFPDYQCTNNRRGSLCGLCKHNTSLVFGSTACKPCHSSHPILRAVGLIVLFAVMGLVFILLIGFLNLTVSEGTLNAIVFYMNVIRVNASIFFDCPSSCKGVNAVLAVFVALMNLDWGIETCFVARMEAVEKTVLAFVFPLYLFTLTGIMIYFSNRSTLITKLVGNNAVKILATIVFHSYAKIVRAIIDILRVSIIFSKHTYSVWSVDGSIKYLEESHVILLILAGVAIAVTLPYTLVLLFIQCLRKKSNVRILRWVNKLKPFFDAYTGPYKDKYHFWTGFLLIVRIALFIAIVTNTTKGPILNLTLISSTTSLLFVLIQPGIYKHWALNIIEAFTYANLTLLAAGTAYTVKLNYSNDVPVILCIGSMFLLFCGVVVYHVLKKLSDTERGRLMKLWLLDMRCPWMRRKPIRSLILPYIDPDGVGDLSSSDDDNELDPILRNAPPVARYDEYREPLIETERNNG